jgi:phosphate-selective porin O/P
VKQLHRALIGSVVLLRVGAAAAQPAPAAPAPAAPAPAAPAPAAPAPAPVVTATVAPPPVVAPAPVLPPAPLPAPEAAPPPPPAPKSLEVGSAKGSWTPSALLQFWGYASTQDMTPKGATVPVADETTVGFRIRRAELRVKGDILPKVILFNVMIDPARALELTNKKLAVSGGGGGSVTAAQPPSDGSPLTILQDYFITFASDYADVSVGQFKIPVSMEGYNGSSKILFPERAPIARKYGDKRDIGIKVEKKLWDHFGYVAEFINGAGQNKLDDDTEKDGALRLEGYVEGLTVAGVGYTTIGKRDKSSRDRLEADIKYDAHNIYVVGEYIHGWDTTNGAKAVEGQGWYVEGAYTLFDHLQPMFRVGEIEPAMHKNGDYFWHIEGGANYLIQKWEAKVGLAIAHYSPSNESNPKKTEGILAVQAGF